MAKAKRERAPRTTRSAAGGAPVCHSVADAECGNASLLDIDAELAALPSSEELADQVETVLSESVLTTMLTQCLANAGVGPEGVLATVLSDLPPLEATEIPEPPAIDDDAPRGRGRPRKAPMKWQLHVVEQLAASGFTIDRICEVIRIDPRTFRNYRRSHFDLPLKRGRARAKLISHAVLMDRVLAGDMRAIEWLQSTQFGISPLVSNQHAASPDVVFIVGLVLPQNGREVPSGEVE